MTQHLLRRALRQAPPPVHDQHPVAEAEQKSALCPPAYTQTAFFVSRSARSTAAPPDRPPHRSPALHHMWTSSRRVASLSRVTYHIRDIIRIVIVFSGKVVMYFIGIDIGTSATKLLLMDEKGSVLRLVQKTYPTCFLEPGWSEQSPESWWKAVCAGISSSA